MENARKSELIIFTKNAKCGSYMLSTFRGKVIQALAKFSKNLHE